MLGSGNEPNVIKLATLFSNKIPITKGAASNDFEKSF